MAITIIPCLQHTAEWYEARLGHCTSSRVSAAVTKPKRKGIEELQARIDYRWDLVTERLTGKPVTHYVSAEMEWGNEYEPIARMAYEAETDCMVTQVGFVLHSRHPYLLSGCSPDGLCGKDGGLEIKCPKTQTHVEYMRNECVPEQYLDQMMWQMACTEREWWDFVSFDPRLPAELRYFVFRLQRNEQRIAEMEREVEQFLFEVERELKELKARGEARKAGKTYLQVQAEESVARL